MFFRDQKVFVLTDEESNMFEINKGTKQGDPLSSLLFNMVPHKALEDDIPRWQKKKGMGIYLSDDDHDCLTSMRFFDDVLLFAFSKGQLQNCCANSREVLKKVGLRNHPGKTKILSNQSSHTRTEIEVDHMESRNTDKRRKREMLGPDDYFPATGDDRNQKSNQGCLGDVSQVQTGTDIEKLFAQTSTPAIGRSDNSDDMLRISNMDTHRRARKNVQTTQRKMLRLIIQTKRRYKKIVKPKRQDQRRKRHQRLE